MASPGASGSLGASKAIVIDGIAPTVDNVSLTSSDGTYSAGDNITLTVSFNDKVYVDNSSGNPRLQLETGSTDNYATYTSGNQTNVLSFVYVVQSVDYFTDLDYKATNSLSTNGGTIRDNVSNDALLTLPSPGSISDNKSVVFLGGKWSQEAYVKSVNNDAGDGFGESVALSGNTLAVGADRESSNQTTITNGTTASSDNSLYAGAVYVYTRSGTSWSQQSYIKAANAGHTDGFGKQISLSDDTLAVMAPRESSNQTTITNGTSASSNNICSRSSVVCDKERSGAIYVYKRSGTSWAQEAYIKATNSKTDNGGNGSLSLDGDTLAWGAPGEDSNQTTITNGTSASSDNSNSGSGAVYVYKRSGTTWAQEAYIKAINNVREGNVFGISVSLDGDTLAVGASGESSNQTTITNGTSASSDNSNSGSGAVYVYRRTGASWAQEAYIKAANNDVNDNFGFGIALDNDTLVVGVPYEDSNQSTITNDNSSASSNNSNSGSGAVYVYKRTGSSWEQEAYIKASNNDVNDYFGTVLYLHNNTLVVAASMEDSNLQSITLGASASSNNSNADSGALYVFKRIGNSWQQEAYIKPVNSEAGDLLGYGSYSVSIDNQTIAIGALGESSNQRTITNGTSASSNNSNSVAGAVYVYFFTKD